MNATNFSSCEQYLFESLSSIRERSPVYDKSKGSIATLLNNIAKKRFHENEQLLLESINTLIDFLRITKNANFLHDSGCAIMHDLLPLINHKNKDLQGSAYVCLQLLSGYLDQDEVAAAMMDHIVCLEDWDLCDVDTLYETSRLSVVLLELFGRALERMTRPRDWMLFLPLFPNHYVMIIDYMVPMLIENSSFGSCATEPSHWDKIFILISNSCLDFIQFLHSTTVAQDVAAFPFNSKDIGKENGDTKRRYLAYYLTNFLVEKVIGNFDMQLAETYFQMHNPVYAARMKLHRAGSNTTANPQSFNHKPMYAIVHRTMEIVLKYGPSFEKLYQLQRSIDHNSVVSDDQMMDNELQVINSRLYPLSYPGIALLMCLSFYDDAVYPTITSKPSMGLLDKKANANKLAQNYIGITMNLAANHPERFSETDKAIFIMLYMADHLVNIKYSLKDLQATIPGPCLDSTDVAANCIIEFISTLASSCPDSTLRFLVYKLIEKFINFGDQIAQLYIIEELLRNCPYPSMHTATIGLLKDHVCRILEQEDFDSLFASHIVGTEFVPMIFRYKLNWEVKESEFWDDYSYIMQALAFYRTLYQKDIKLNVLAMAETGHTVNSIYFEPLSKLLDRLDTQLLEKGMKVETMKYQIELIQKDILSHEQ